jgi:hypothetical protein
MEALFQIQMYKLYNEREAKPKARKEQLAKMLLDL